MEIKVGQAYVGKDGQWYYYTEEDVRREQTRKEVAYLLHEHWDVMGPKPDQPETLNRFKKD